MTEPFDRLLLVQEHDTALDQLRHRRETLPERAQLADVGHRRADRTVALTAAETAVGELSGRQKHLEEQIAAAAARRHEIEERMRTGGITASRDLQAMDQEVQHLALRQSQLEEDEIALLEEEEPLDLEVAELRSALSALDGEAERLGTAIADADADIATAISHEEAARAEIAAGLPEELARRYEALRARLGGVGAAKLVGDRCGGCHLTMSAVEVERIRHLPAEDVATCSQCDRILVR
jgi:predicted  nucleic acid-binding Zn-ribbon protein